MTSKCDAPSPDILPLHGLKIIDFTLARAGPTCVRHLADWGADVIRVEPPSNGGEDVTGDRDGPDFQNLHRGKRIISLNLKDEEGYEAFLRLIKDADVFVENMRPDVKRKLRISWDDLHAVNERLVYGSISGFGQDGPYVSRPGVDQIAQGMGGLMSITGKPGHGPLRVGIPITDLTAGNLLALSIMMALFERQRTGLGRWVHTSLLESQVFMLDFQAARYLVKGEIPEQAGNDHPTGIPSGVFSTADGHINVAAGSTRMWERLCDALGRPEWKSKVEWQSQLGRSADRARINALIAAIISEKTSAEWIAALDAAGVPCGPIYSVDEVFADPQVQHLGLADPVEHPRLGPLTLVNSPLNFEGVQKHIAHAAHERGGDTGEVLASLGYSEGDIERLQLRGAI